jgi:hypothetical protein
MAETLYCWIATLKTKKSELFLNCPGKLETFPLIADDRQYSDWQLSFPVAQR